MATTPKKQRISVEKIGYLHSVSPLKTSRSKAKYFNAVIQTMKDNENIVCFKAEAHKTFEDMAQSRTPVCLENIDSIPSLTSKGKFDVKFTSYSKITSPKETITFPFKEIKKSSCDLKTIAEIGHCEVHDKVNLLSKVVLVMPEEKIRDLMKSETTVADETGSITLTLWNEQIKLVNLNHTYKFTNLKVRKYQDIKSLTCTMETTIMETEDIETVEIKAIEQWHEVEMVEVSITKNCPNCGNAINEDSDVTIKCQKCLKKMLKTKLSELVNVKVTINNQEFNLNAGLLEQLNPQWKQMILKEQEDFILLQTEMKVHSNSTRVIDIRMKNSD